MKTLATILITLAIIFLAIWLTRAVYEADVPNWYQMWKGE